MSNRVFRSQRGGFAAPAATAANEAGGAAYALSPELALAQMAATCTFGDAYYSSAEDQLKAIVGLLPKVSAELVAKIAVFARQRGYMKDMPALLACYLTTLGNEGMRHLEKAFPKIIDNGKMFLRFFEILWSNVTGRDNIGHRPRRLLQQMLDRTSPEMLFRWDIGKPSMKDVITMMHPKPATPQHSAIYRYFLKKDGDPVSKYLSQLPELVQQFEAFKAMKQVVANGAKMPESGLAMEVPAVPFQRLDGLPSPLTTAEWGELFKKGGWHFCRMNLQTALRHGVYNDPAMVDLIAAKLRDPDVIRKARVFPYQILMAFKMNEGSAPTKITNALQDAMEVACENVPAIEGNVAVCIDTSGSMTWPVTGMRGGATSKVLAVDVAGLVAASLLRKNPDATTIVPFDTRVHRVAANPRDSVMTNARKLALHGGGTDCSVALKHLNAQKHKGNLVIYVSDNEAWVETPYAEFGSIYGSRATGMATAWAAYKKRNPKAQLVNINVYANTSNQMPENHPDVYQIGGFSDQVFTYIGDWSAGRAADYWLDQIKAIDLDKLTAKM